MSESQLSKMLKTRISHKEFSAEVQRIAKAFGWLCYFTWRSDHSPSGYPDITLCKSPWVIFMELKTEKDEETMMQKVWGDALSECPGVEYYCMKPHQLDDIVKTLARKE